MTSGLFCLLQVWKQPPRKRLQVVTYICIDVTEVSPLIRMNGSYLKLTW